MYKRKYYTPGSYEWMPHDDNDEIWELSRLMHLEYWHVCNMLGELEAGLIERMQDVRYHIQRKGWDTKASREYLESIEQAIHNLSSGTLNLFFMDGAYYGTELYGGRAWVILNEKVRATESALEEVDDYIVKAINTYNERHDEAKALLAWEKVPRRRTWVKPQ
jgi:hypothetical protein